MTATSRRILFLGAIILIVTVVAVVFRDLAHRPVPPSPQASEIIVIGDSQLSFGAGPVLSGFFEDLPNQCREHLAGPQQVSPLENKRFGMIGVRSTSLQSWTTRDGRAWELLCQKDKRWGVNASAWGTLKPPDRRYIQVGEGEDFQFCKAGGTPLQQLFATGYYAPELLMVFVGGNGAARLARDPLMAKQDVDAFLQDVPKETSCVFMMTAPVYTRAQNAQRLAAQANLKSAFADHGDRCTFVDGHTPETRASIEGQARFFRRRDDGSVKDPYHANEEAAGLFLKFRKPALCRALSFQLRRRSAGGAS